jgi:hypothetical protein
MNTVDVSSEIVIAAPREKVAEFSADPDNATKWYKKIHTAIWKTEKPLRVGSKIAFSAKFLGKNLEYTYEITEFVPGKKLVMQTAEGPFPMETTYVWETVDGNKTKMILRNAGSPSGFSKLFAPLMSGAMKRANRKDLELLKELMEK